MRALLLSLSALYTCASMVSVASAQAPAPMPRELHASVGIPGGTNLAVMHMTFGTDWTIDGCITTPPGRCTRTRRVVLTPAQRREFVQLWMQVTSMPLCEPLAFAPGDPAYSITTPGASYDGHLPAARGDIAARTSEVCAADARLAWWLAERLGA